MYILDYTLEHEQKVNFVNSDNKIKKSLTLEGFLGNTEGSRRSSPSSPIVTERFGFAAEAAQRIFLEAVRVVEGKTIGFFPFN